MSSSNRKLYIDNFPLTNLSMKEHVKVQFRKLIAVDKIRMHKLLFISQYGLLYVFTGMFLGSVTDYMFPKYDSDKDHVDILKEIVFQTIFALVAIFYSRKLVKICPYLFNFDNSFSHSHAQNIPEYQGTIILTLVFVATQTSLLKKIQHISKNVIIKKLKNEKDDDDAEFIAQNSKPIEVQSKTLQATNPNQLSNNTRVPKGINTAMLHQNGGGQPVATFDNMSYHQNSQNLGEMAMTSGQGTAHNLESSNNQHTPYQTSNDPNTMNMMSNFAGPSPLLSGDSFGDNYSYLDNGFDAIKQAAYM
jgi:hypothetical protein